MAAPSEPAADGRAALISSILWLGEKIESVVRQVEENFNASSDLYHFMKLGNRNGITPLFAVSHAYSDCMKRVGVQSRVELERLWAQHYGHAEVRDAVETLLEAEEAFTELVGKVERKLVPYEDMAIANRPAIVGKLLPKELGLIDASSGQPTTLDTYWKDSKFTLFVLVRHFG